MSDEERKEYHRNWYLKNRERVLKNQKEYNEKNRDKVKAGIRKWRDKNSEKVKVQVKQYYENNKVRMDEYYKSYRLENKDKIAENNKRLYENNRERKLQKGKEWSRNNIEKIRLRNRLRRANDPLYKLKSNIRVLIGNALKKRGWQKLTKTQNILGCDFDTLQAHLIQTAVDRYGCFEEGAAYHIDHIIPLALAESEEDIIELNHYSNLQWLTPKDNLSKGVKLCY
jgi:hypothetical protein